MRRSTHSTLRRLVGTSVVTLAIVVPAGVAAAAVNDYPTGNPPAVSGNNTSAVKASTATKPASTLPVHRWRRGRARADRRRRRARGHGARAPLPPPRERLAQGPAGTSVTATTSTVGRSGVASG